MKKCGCGQGAWCSAHLPFVSKLKALQLYDGSGDTWGRAPDAHLSASPTPPERYGESSEAGEYMGMAPFDDGEWVRWEDYEALREARDVIYRVMKGQLDALKAEKERLEEERNAFRDEAAAVRRNLLAEAKDMAGRADQAECERDTLRDAVRAFMVARDSGRAYKHELDTLRSLVSDPDPQHRPRPLGRRE